MASLLNCALISFRNELASVPGTHDYLEGESPSLNLMEVKSREAQGRHCEVGSEGSVDQRYELTNRNWIRGTKVGRVS